jgi:hypothetical protein
MGLRLRSAHGFPLPERSRRRVLKTNNDAAHSVLLGLAIGDVLLDGASTPLSLRIPVA